MPNKLQLDMLIVQRRITLTRKQAQALIMTGRVRCDGIMVDKAGTRVPYDADLSIDVLPTYVSRGGDKLAHALLAFNVQIQGCSCVDVGASTGGFTDCLLQNQASKVYAVDVGYGQLAQRIRENKRVVVMERVNAHFPFELPCTMDIATIDVSFISLTKILPNVANHLSSGGYILALVKPQFEAKRSDVGRRGVILDPKIHSNTLGKIINWAVDYGLRVRNITASPILGRSGNREFMLLLQQPQSTR
jgi:23S rRNA (cytidine1920-2'-O)/16S rRNA (cytidine1409-2'-O)-methyltransferase